MNTKQLRSRALFAAIVASASLSGCTLVATKAEYADYRAVRLAEDDRARLIAMQRYVANNPTGYWHERFEAERTERENEIYESGKTTREGLEFYLAAYPDGQFAEQARPRLQALQAVQGRRESEAEAARQTQAQRQAQRQEQRRTWVTRAVTYWTHTLLGIQNWGSPISDVARINPAFSRAFGENPRPRCTSTECDKFYANAYAIPVPGATRIDRTIQIVLRLKMNNGAVNGAELLLPTRGFSRWYEMENRVAVTDEDPSQREQVIAWVLERLVPAITSGLSGVTAAEASATTLAPIAPLAFTAEGTRTGTSTPGSGGTDAADESEDEEGAAPSATAPAAHASDQATPPTTPTSVDALMAQATGSTTPAAAGTPAEPAAAAQVAAATASAPTPIAPVASRVFTTPQLRVVIFTASDEDYEAAYDGVSIDVNTPVSSSTPATAPATTPARGTR